MEYGSCDQEEDEDEWVVAIMGIIIAMHHGCRPLFAAKC